MWNPDMGASAPVKRPNIIMRGILRKDAPETLREPKAGSFVNDSYYKKALAKFKKKGHWATPDPKDTGRVKLFSSFDR
jgi:hypothetical protein